MRDRANTQKKSPPHKDPFVQKSAARRKGRPPAKTVVVQIPDRKRVETLEQRVLQSSIDLHAVNEKLSKQIAERERVEEQLLKNSIDLHAVNEKLLKQISERERVEEQLLREQSELQVHRIELEMQNEELRRLQVELETSRARYFDLYNLAPVGYLTINEKSLILEANLMAAKLLDTPKGDLVMQRLSRFVLPEDRDIYYLHRKRLLDTNTRQACELRMVKKDGTPFWVAIEEVVVREADRTPLCHTLIGDITERRRLEERERFAQEVLSLLNRQMVAPDTIGEILQLIKKKAGFEAVGIRLKKGDDFPYYAVSGFPEGFVLAEMHLYAADEEERSVREEQGNSVMDCMCGNIIRGCTDASMPFFTVSGSFWTNSTTELLASTAQKEWRSCPRNRCHSDGYESIALIPLRSGNETIGLLQLNDRRRNRFTPESIIFLESLATSIGIALSRKRAEEALLAARDSLERLVAQRTTKLASTNARLLAEIEERKKIEAVRQTTEGALRGAEENFHRSLDDSPLGVRIVTVLGETLYANKALLDIYGYDSLQELTEIPVKARYTEESYNEFKTRFEKRLQGEDVPAEYEISIIRKDGEIRRLQVFRRVVLWDTQEHFQAIYLDITDRVRMEKELREREAELAAESQLLAETNTALRVLLQRREEDIREMEKKIVANFQQLVLPYLSELQRHRSSPVQLNYLDIIESNLQQIIDPFLQNLTTRFANFTSREIQIANLIKDGKSSKEIADILMISVRSVEFHRDNIRKKLGISHKASNLRSFLLTLSK